MTDSQHQTPGTTTRNSSNTRALREQPYFNNTTVTRRRQIIGTSAIRSHSLSASLPSVTGIGPLIPPNTSFARAVVSGSQDPSPDGGGTGVRLRPSGRRSAVPNPPTPAKKPVSNLTALLNQQEKEEEAKQGLDSSWNTAETHNHLRDIDEADSASGPSVPHQRVVLGSSAPSARTAGARKSPDSLSRQQSSDITSTVLGDRVRRCLSSKELGTLAPPSGSPYANLLLKKEELETSMRQRLQAMRDGQLPSEYVRNLTETHSDENSSASSYRRAREGANQLRHRRRAEHNQAVIDDLCEVVADLFVAESKLLKPVNYGVLEDATSCNSQRERIVTSTRNFLAALPTRYALGADTPSEVLLHMRLMAAARSDKSKAAVHIHNLEDDGNWGRTVVAASAKHQKLLRLVTISCNDATGLLELITRNLATGGSRVMDADVMLSTDGIVLDRFVVEMNGRLRLDKMVDLIETFLRENIVSVEEQSEPFVSTGSGSADGLPAKEPSGPLYYKSAEVPQELTPRDFHKEMETAVPLLEVLASSASGHLLAPDFPKLRRLHSMPNPLSTVLNRGIPNLSLTMRSPALDGVSISSSPVNTLHNVRLPSVELDRQGSMRERRPLVNRRGSSDLDRFGEETTAAVPLDYVTVSNTDTHLGEGRDIPLIPFEELMLIETIGTGRVSTIYRAAWQNSGDTLMPSSVNMVALKVAMVDPSTGDTSHIDEVRREADIAARLHHPNICDLVGVAADLECFCLAYDFCEGGSLLSLLTDSRRYYEYLPIALDVANGMAYLHNRNVIHRDLKPSNILLTRDHRAKIADFGMSVANAGQELTAETGTYRYMAPEVIRHESYSSNADVYSFGVCLWQLITREIPFATMTPIQAAYAVAEGRRPEIPSTTPRRLQEIIMACWDQDSHRRPSFTYIAMALADYAKMAFSPANVGALTLQIANEMLANVEGNSTVNVDFTTPVASSPSPFYMGSGSFQDSVHGSTIGLEIE